MDAASTCAGRDWERKTQPAEQQDAEVRRRHGDVARRGEDCEGPGGMRSPPLQGMKCLLGRGRDVNIVAERMRSLSLAHLDLQVEEGGVSAHSAQPRHHSTYSD